MLSIGASLGRDGQHAYTYTYAGTATCWPLAGRPLLPSYPLASPDRDSGSDHGSESNHTPVDHENNLIVRLILTYGSGGSPVYIPIPCLFSH